MKSVYTGDEKVAEFESYDELRVGENKPAFIYEGSELVYPNPVKDGLVLWYDFSGRTNTDGQRGIAEDLSGNGNHGTLQNFNFTPESGYDKNKLLFDGVDDYIDVARYETSKSFTISMTVETSPKDTQFLFGASHNAFYLRKYLGNRLHASVWSDKQYTISEQGFFTDEYEVSDVSYILDFTNKKLSIAGNGVVLVSTDFNGDYEDILIRRLGVWILGNGDHLDGGLLSTKIYNRPLSPEEIQHNYAIEKERFNIGGAE